MADFDYVLEGGIVVDGSGRPPVVADVGWHAGRIAAVGTLRRARAQKRVAVHGAYVCPGFIDTHDHADLALLREPGAPWALSQGVTTLVLAPDGLSYAPLPPDAVTAYLRYVGGLNGRRPALSLPDFVAACRSVAAFRRLFDRRVAVNTVYQVPHGPLRLSVLGFHDAPVGAAELKRLEAALERGIADGAAGLATGLSYVPQSWAETAELTALARVLKPAGLPLVVHTRTVFRRLPDHWEDAARAEVLAVGRDSGAPVHISHYRTRPDTAGRAQDLLAPLTAARQAGVDVSFDLYPYEYGSSIGPYWTPAWAWDGGPDAFRARLQDKDLRRRIIRDMADGPAPPGPDDVIAYVGSHPDWTWAVGRPLRAVAERLAAPSLAEAVLTLLEATDLEVGYHGAPAPDEATRRRLEEDFLTLLAWEQAMVGSDGIHVGEARHPRAYGAFLRFGRLAQEHGRPAWPEVVRHMTAVPAARFRLRDRGRIAPGYAADLIVLAPGGVRERASLATPTAPGDGVRLVFVNGVLAWENGHLRDTACGRALSPGP